MKPHIFVQQVCFFLSPFCRNSDDQLSSNFYRLVILCINVGIHQVRTLVTDNYQMCTFSLKYKQNIMIQHLSVIKFRLLFNFFINFSFEFCYVLHSRYLWRTVTEPTRYSSVLLWQLSVIGKHHCFSKSFSGINYLYNLSFCFDFRLSSFLPLLLIHH